VVIRRQVVVRGRVQGVFFRDSCREQARLLGVTGWVRNRSDGASVEAAFEGSEEAVRRMVAWCHHGPPRAFVEAVDVTEHPPEGDTNFRVRG
jgi:acylphosphatase